MGKEDAHPLSWQILDQIWLVPTRRIHLFSILSNFDEASWSKSWEFDLEGNRKANDAWISEALCHVQASGVREAWRATSPRYQLRNQVQEDH